MILKYKIYVRIGMIVALLLLMTLAQNILHAADAPGAQGIQIQFSAPHTQSGLETITFQNTDALMKFKTIESMLNDLDLNSSGTIDLSQAGITYAAFKFLLDFINNPNKPDIFTVDLEPQMNKLIRYLLKNLSDAPSVYDLMIAANYLQSDQIYINALAVLYADEVKLLENYRQNQEIPGDLQPLVAGFLLYDLLNNVPLDHKITREYSLKSVTGSFITDGSKDAFTCIFRKPKYLGLFNEFIKSVISFSQDNQQPLQSLSINNNFDISKFYGAMSSDGLYTSCIGFYSDTNDLSSQTNINIIFNNTENTALKLSYPEKKNLYTESIVYDDVNKKFYTISTYDYIYNRKLNIRHPETIKTTKTTENIKFYEINPSNKPIERQEIKSFNNKKINELSFPASAIHWNCVHGKLIGTCKLNDGDIHKLIFIFDSAKKELFLCSTEYHLTNNPFDYTWEYTNQEGQKLEATFSLIDTYVTATDYSKKTKSIIAIENLFIPYFADLISALIEKMDKNAPLQGMHNFRFDANYFRFNFVNTSENIVGMHYLFNPDIVATIKQLNSKILNGEKEILREAHALYQKYKNAQSSETKLNTLPTQQNWSTAQSLNYYKNIIQRNLGQAWTSSTQAVFNRIPMLANKKILYGLGALGATGLTAWLVSKYASQHRIISPQ